MIWYSTDELESRERNRHFCVWITPNWNTPLTLGKWIEICWCPLLSLDSEGTSELKFRHNTASLKTCMKQFYSWSFLEEFDDHKLVTCKTSLIFQTCLFFFPSLCCLTDTLVFWLIHHSPGYFPAWNCSQQVMNECSALTLPEQSHSYHTSHSFWSMMDLSFYRNLYYLTLLTLGTELLMGSFQFNLLS